MSHNILIDLPSLTGNEVPRKDITTTTFDAVNLISTWSSKLREAHQENGVAGFTSKEPRSNNEWFRRGRFLIQPVKSSNSLPAAKELLEEVFAKSKIDDFCAINNLPEYSSVMTDSSCLLEEVMSWDVSSTEALNPCNLSSPDLIITCSRKKEKEDPFYTLDESRCQERFVVRPTNSPKSTYTASVGGLMQEFVQLGKIECCELKPNHTKEMIALMENEFTDNIDWVAHWIDMNQRNVVQLRIWLSLTKAFETKA